MEPKPSGAFSDYVFTNIDTVYTLKKKFMFMNTSHCKHSIAKNFDTDN